MNRKNTILKSTLLATSVVTISAVTNVTVHADDMASKTQNQNTPEKQIAKKQDNNNQQLSALK